MTKRKRIKIGSRIRFKAATRASYKAVWRVVNGFDAFGRPTVRYEGWSDFVVMPKEIMEIA